MISFMGVGDVFNKNCINMAVILSSLTKCKGISYKNTGNLKQTQFHCPLFIGMSYFLYYEFLNIYFSPSFNPDIFLEWWHSFATGCSCRKRFHCSEAARWSLRSGLPKQGICMCICVPKTI